MTAIGARKHDRTGRTTGQIKTNGRMKILGQWVPYPTDMLGSPAFRVLSLSGHRVLARVGVEHGKHGGAENGRLPVTFQDFENYGIDRHAIAPAIRECVALGFLTITKKGRSGNGEWRHPNVFKINFLHTTGVAATNEWARIETDEDAGRIAKEARSSVSRAARGPTAPLRGAARAAMSVSSQDIESGGVSPIVKAAASSGEIPHREGKRQWGEPTLTEVINPHRSSDLRAVISGSIQRIPDVGDGEAAQTFLQ